MKVKKRDGSIVNFDGSKISNAIGAANKAVSKPERATTIEKKEIIKYIKSLKQDIMSVEEIQDIIENKLMEFNHYELVKKYILYREERTKIRNRNSQLMRDISKKIEASDVQNQNANVDEHSFGGRAGEARDELLKNYALNYIVSDMSKNNHLNNEIYIHDLSSYALGNHNCFNRSTKFITSEGIRTFENFKDGDVVKVLDYKGEWREATIRYFGHQDMVKVTFSRPYKKKEVICTKNHRWVLADGSITENIKIGDILWGLVDTTNFIPKTKREKEMFCFGFVLGDGCDHGKYIQARLCKKKQIYSDYFKEAGYHQNKINNSDDIVFVKRTGYSKQQFLTNKEWRLLSFEDKVALFNGYYSADGGQTTSTKVIWTSDERILNMIKEISCLAGYHIFSIKETKNSTNYKEDRILYNISFSTHYEKNSSWKVEKIERYSYNSAAWCVVEPITHTFTLEGGVPTGNCLSIPFDDLLAKGFNTRQVDIRPANSINTAFQLLAVIFQIQSLQQFGGVSATHLDWTMVPYVRKSFFKHWKDGQRYLENDIDVDDLKFNPDLSIDDEYYRNYSKAYRYATDMTKRELDQAVEGMYHNLNSLQSRSGNQLPFTSINYGTCTLTEGRMVIKALLEGSIKGVGKLHRTPVFPCGIFQCMKGVNRKEGEPNYDLFKLALKSTAQRLYPNYANVDWSGNEGYDKNDPKTYFSTMGKCKL